MRLIRVCAIIISLISSYSAQSYFCSNPSFEADGHCLSENKRAWSDVPTYLMELQLWGDQFGNPLPTNQVYDLLVQGVLQWNGFPYNNIGNPGRIALTVFPNNNYMVIFNDNVNSIIFSSEAVEDICPAAMGCEASREFEVLLTTDFGGINKKRSSDIYLSDGPWSIPPITDECWDLGHADIMGFISHEVGHGLGLGHKSRDGENEQHPVMENDICSPFGNQATPRFPIDTDKEDVDFLYGLTGGLNEITILQPQNGQNITWLSLLSFIGSAIDVSGNDVSSEIRWESSIQGFLGMGPSLPDVVLAPGYHVISADTTQTTENSPKSTSKSTTLANIYHLQEATRASGVSTSAITINVEGPIVNTFSVDDNPCFIDIMNDSCNSSLEWEVVGEIPPGQMLIYQDGNILSSGITSGNMPVTLFSGSNQFDLKFRDTSGVEHELASLNAQAGLINANISGPIICEIDPPPPDSCSLIISLSGFAPNIHVYNDFNELLYEGNVNGYFQTDISVNIPQNGLYLGVFFKDGDQSILLDSQSYTTFRIADQFEDDDFVKYPHSLNASFEVANIFLNQTQVNHNFHKNSDIDFIRIPFPSNLGMSSLRTVNLSNSISTNIEMGCVVQIPAGWQYEKLNGALSGSVSDGLQDGSSVYTWPTGSPQSGCGGDAYFAKITRSGGPVGEDSSYDVIYLNALEDLYEPDDQASDAKSIVIDQIQDRNFSIDRIDYVNFTPSIDSQFNFSLSSDSPFVNPCITISSKNSIIANECMSDNSIDIPFEANAELLIKIENNTSRIATDYQILVSPFTGAKDIYEDDDIPSQSVIFANGHGTHKQFRNFFDDNIDLFQFMCFCPDVVNWIPQSSVQINAISNDLCIVAVTNPSGATLCENSVAGIGTDYLIEHTCDCGPGYP